MKRLNYYQVHKNKKPKKIGRKKVNVLQLKLALIHMQSFAQHSLIVSQSFNSIAEKSFAIIGNNINHANAVLKVLKEERKNSYIKKIS